MAPTRWFMTGLIKKVSSGRDGRRKKSQLVIQKFKPGKAQIRVSEHGRHITNQYTKELSHKHTKTRGSQNTLKKYLKVCNK